MSGGIKKPPLLLGILFRLPWFLKRYILTHPLSWRVFTGVCRRTGWDYEQLGWYLPNNGPYSGILLPALHPNCLWLPLGGYEPEVTRRLVHLLTDPVWGCVGCEFWDVGAHQGYTSLLCAKYGSRRVTAFEPDATNLAYLAENLAANPALRGRIEVLPVAVAEASGEAQLESPDDLSQCRLISHEFAARAGSPGGLHVTTVTSVTLDSILSEGRTPPGLMKIDVEGAEHLVLRGARQLVQRFHPVILLEYHNAEARKQCVAFLEEAGYSIFALNGKRSGSEPLEGSAYGHVLAA